MHSPGRHNCYHTQSRIHGDILYSPTIAGMQTNELLRIVEDSLMCGQSVLLSAFLATKVDESDVCAQSRGMSCAGIVREMGLLTINSGGCHAQINQNIYSD